MELLEILNEKILSYICSCSLYGLCRQELFSWTGPQSPITKELLTSEARIAAFPMESHVVAVQHCYFPRKTKTEHQCAGWCRGHVTVAQFLLFVWTVSVTFCALMLRSRCFSIYKYIRDLSKTTSCSIARAHIRPGASSKILSIAMVMWRYFPPFSCPLLSASTDTTVWYIWTVTGRNTRSQQEAEVPAQEKSFTVQISLNQTCFRGDELRRCNDDDDERPCAHTVPTRCSDHLTRTFVSSIAGKLALLRKRQSEDFLQICAARHAATSIQLDQMSPEPRQTRHNAVERGVAA